MSSQLLPNLSGKTKRFSCALSRDQSSPERNRTINLERRGRDAESGICQQHTLLIFTARLWRHQRSRTDDPNAPPCIIIIALVAVFFLLSRR